MATGFASSGTSALFIAKTVTWGFVTRLLYGFLGFLLVVLVRPDFLGQNLHQLVMTVAIYLVVCLGGGASDAFVGREPRRPSLPKGTTRDILVLVLLVLILISLWLGR